jgi:hypothetical protein
VEVRMCGRTEPTVRHGIKQDTTDGNLRLVEYHPGNGSRYTIVLTKLPDRMCTKLGLQSGSFHISIVGGVGLGSSMTLGPSGYLSVSYVAEKLKLSEPDASVLTELFGYLTGRKTANAYSPN